jgi:zinc/manganese transport system ATP-binding protein
MTPLIRLNRVAAEAGERKLWSDVDLEVSPAEFVALLGPNGVGKSTLIKMLLGLHPIAAGQITVFGRSPVEARNEVGYLPQRRRFDPELRVRARELVRLGLDGDRWGFPLPFSRNRAAAERVAEVVKLVDATEFIDRPIGELSGGEQQRVLIAQALVRAPKILLLDEPLDSLDLPTQSSIAALLSRICHDQGVAVVMVAHDVNPIMSYLDRVVYIAGGRAIVGHPIDVITGPTLSMLYGTPIEVLHAADGSIVVVGQPEPPSFHSDRHHDDGHHHEYDRDPRRPHAH